MSQTWTDDTYAGGHTAATDLQNIEYNFAALKSAFSGTSAPSGPVDGTLWRDTTQLLWKGYNGSSWYGLMHGDISQKLWVYRDAAMDGWAVDSAVSDVVLALKGGTDAYNVTGGNTAGTWTQPTHTHAVGTFAVASHNHQWFHGLGSPNNDQTYDVNGNLIDFSSTTKASGRRLPIDTTSNCPGQQDYYTDNQSPALSGASASNGTPSTYRPAAAVGTLQYLDI